MKSKKLPGAGAAAIGAATAVTVLLLGTGAATAQDSRPDSAFGIAASGALTIDPVPYVESDGDPVSDELIGLGDVRGATAGGLGAGVLTVDAGGGAAESSVTKLNVLGLLRADLVRTHCDAGRGGLQIVGGEILSQALPEVPLSGQTIDLSPLLGLTLGEQTRNADGSLTVTGIEISVLPAAETHLDEQLTGEESRSVPAIGDLLGADLAEGAGTVGDVVAELTGALGTGLDMSGAVQTITIGSATCTAPDPVDEPDADRPSDEKTPEAPKPEIVEADLPVTG